MPDVAPRQPWLHEMNICTHGNVTALSSRAGDMSGASGTGLYVDDRRALSEFAVLVDGQRPELLAEGALGSRAEFFASARNLGLLTADPVVEVRRHRRLVDGGMVESVVVVSRAEEARRIVLTVRLGSDGASMASIKSGYFDAPAIAPSIKEGKGAQFTADWHEYAAVFDPGPDHVAVDGAVLVASFDLDLKPQKEASVGLTFTATRRRASEFDANPGGQLLRWDDVHVTGADPRLGPTVSASITDLRSLVMTDPTASEDVFAGAGTPWYLTLFGRDSLWAARLTLPIGTDLARGTLRSLARRQGTRYGAASAEAPGKIPHEVYRLPLIDPETRMSLPSVYYGTVDATALWVLLLHDAWRWGLEFPDVHELLGPLRAAVGWLLTDAMPDPDGLLKYHDHSSHRLSNQGWKDSGDAIRFRDGSIATGPIALLEAQAYAVAALASAADLFEAFGCEGATGARDGAATLRQKIRDRFWVRRDEACYLGMAVAGDGRLVDGIGSNMGHVLGTGVLSPGEVAAVCAQLTGPELLDPYGVRTLGVGNGGFNPIGYHTGSIWTHDTAITAVGLSEEGRVHDAVTVARTLLASAEAFDYRWPELHSGAATFGRPAPYPAACRPQSWSAASAVALLSVALGPRPDATTRTLHLHPVRPAAYGAMRFEGLRFCGGRVDLDMDASGDIVVLRAPAGVSVEVHAAGSPDGS